MSPADLSNAWYYTFSSIPQALSAAYAVMLAVALVHLQEIHRRQSSIASQLRVFCEKVKLPSAHTIELEQLAVQRKWKPYLSKMTVVPTNPSVKDNLNPDDYQRSLAHHQTLINQMTGLVAHADSLGQKIQSLFKSTAIVVAITLAAIPFGVLVQNWPTLAFACAVGIIMTCGILWQHHDIIRAIGQPN